MSLFSLLLCSVFWGTPYILYIRKKWLFSPCGRVFLFFCLIQKKRKRKEKIKATSPGLLRKGRSGAEKWTRFVALRSNSIFQRRPAIPPLTPLRLGQLFFHAKALRCWLFISALPCLRLLLFSSVYFYVYSVKYLSISHWKLCLLARNSLYLGWVYIYLT